MNEPEASSSSDGRQARRKRVFKNFAEYWHFAKVLSERQRELLAECLSRAEQKSLRASFDRGGWGDLFARNACDEVLDRVKRQYEVDLLDLRTKVLSGKPQLVEKKFWSHIHDLFENIPFEQLYYIFGGIVVSEHDEDYVRLSRRGD